MSDASLFEQAGFGVAADRFGVALASCACWWCGEATRVAGLVVEAGHRERLDNEWVVVPEASMLSRLRDVDPDSLRAIVAIAPWMSLIQSATAGGTYLGNACEHCGALQGDHYLQCEPGCAFWPDSEAPAAAIAVTWVDAPLRAACDGKSCGLQWEQAY